MSLNLYRVRSLNLWKAVLEPNLKVISTNKKRRPLSLLSSS